MKGARAFLAHTPVPMDMVRHLPLQTKHLIEEHRSMSHNGDDDYNGRNDDDENDGTMRTGMMKRRRKRRQQ